MSRGALLEAAARGDVVRVRSLLRADPAACAAADENGCSALQRAAADGHVQVVELLLQHGADPAARDHVHGNTALHEAAWKGYSRCVAALARGPALGATNAAGFAPLHLACQNGHNQSCRELLLAGAPPDQKNNYGDTALHTAARYGHAGVTRILLSAQCRVTERNKNGDTALHVAAAMARRKLVRLLRRAGADPAVRNLQRETPRDIAARKRLAEVVALLDAPAAALPDSRRRDRSRDNKKKKNVHFEKPPPPEVQWSPYGCHYYPDPKRFPKPRLSSLPPEPLRKGEQYYLDLAGNIKKGPIGAGYACYCAPLFKHIEAKMDEDKKDIVRHIDRAHERFDQKVTDLEMRTRGRLSELARAVAAGRQHCQRRHPPAPLARAAPARASERRAAPASPPPPLVRARSLELVDARRRDPAAAAAAAAARLAAARSADPLHDDAARAADSDQASPAPSRHDADSPAAAFGWRSRVLQRTADDIERKIRLDGEVSRAPTRDDPESMDISHDGYVKLRKQGSHQEAGGVEGEPRRSVQELVARVERRSRSVSPASAPAFNNPPPTETDQPPPLPPQPSHSILKMSQQPQRPAPVLKDKPSKTKRFSLHNLIPFPTRKAFQSPPKENDNQSESSDEEDAPIRSAAPPGPMAAHRAAGPQPAAPQLASPPPCWPADLRRMVPKDAYFHELPSRPLHDQPPYRDAPGLPLQGRSRTPLYHHQNGALDAVLQERILREMERTPHCYSDRLDQNTEVEIASHDGHYRGYYDGPPPADRDLLTRLRSLAIDTQLTQSQSQADRESHDDSGYSTKVYGSSQGPSPSLSGRGAPDHDSAQRLRLANGNATGQIGASSLV